jgi:hypothetical protein
MTAKSVAGIDDFAAISEVVTRHEVDANNRGPRRAIVARDTFRRGAEKITTVGQEASHQSQGRIVETARADVVGGLEIGGELVTWFGAGGVSEGLGVAPLSVRLSIV